MANTFQTNAKQATGDMTKYSLFLGGLNVTRDALKQYDPLRSGYGRLFMIRTPIFVTQGLGVDKMNNFKHILEFGNTGITGVGQDISLSPTNMTGGYNGRQVEIPSVTQDNATDLSVQVYEFSGSPVREVIQYWITGISDPQSGLSTYHRSSAPDNVGLESALYNETAEFIYVATDNTGYNVEYACMLANCWPDTIPLQHFEYNSGQHEAVQLTVKFNCVRYISPQINKVAGDLIKKYNGLMDSLNFHSGFDVNDDDERERPGTYYEGRNNDDRGQIVRSSEYNNTFVETYSTDGNDSNIFTTDGAGPNFTGTIISR